MAYNTDIKFSISAVSNARANVDLNPFVRDYEKGYYPSSSDFIIDGIYLTVFNVSINQTVSCNVTFLNRSFNLDFYSKYEDTIERSIFKDISAYLTNLEVYNMAKAANGILPIVITSGLDHFKSPSPSANAYVTTIPKATDVTYSGNVVNKPIKLTVPNVGYQSQFAIYDKDAYNRLLWSGTSMTNEIIVPANTIPLNFNAKIEGQNALFLESSLLGYIPYGGASKDNSNWTKFVPNVNNLICLQNNIDYPIQLSWLCDDQQQYEIEAYVDNVKVYNAAGTTSKTHTIQVGNIKKTTNVRFQVRAAFDGTWSEWESLLPSMSRIVPSITNFNVVGDKWEKAIQLNWRADNQSKAEIELLRNNVVFKSYTVTGSANSFTVAAGQIIQAGEVVFRVRPVYIPTWSSTDTSIGAWQEKSVTLTDIVPTLNNIVLSGSNIDLDLTLSWESTDQQQYEVAIFKDDTSVKTYNGTTAKSILIAHNQLSIGLHKFKVRVAYAGRFTEWKEITSTLIETLPSIGVLEPDGVITERDNPIRIWWTSQNQSKWQLIIDGTTTYTGTTEKEKLLQAGTLTTGQHSMVLTVWYVTSLGVEKTPVTKKAEWIVQGKPPTPTITCNNTFSTNRPVITWDTQDQQGYILDVLKGADIVYSTDWNNGLIVEHKIMEYLPNGVYTVQVKTMNQYSLESEYGAKQITINTSESASITLESIALENFVDLKWDNIGSKFKLFYVIRNGNVIAKTATTSYTDYVAHGECIYKIRGITSDDIFVDSNITYEECIVYYGVLSTVDHLENMINVGISINDWAFDGAINLESTQITLAGRELPVTIFGEHSTNTYTLSFKSDELFRFLEMCKRRKTFCYRDKRQKLYLSISTPEYIITRQGLTYKAQALEVDYKEVISYE